MTIPIPNIRGARDTLEMQGIVPYQSGEAALEALDSGGRFYNIFSDASDGEITAAELAKVAVSFMDF